MIAESIPVALIAAFAAVAVATLGLVGVLRGTAKQMKPNGGASMRDVADRTEAKVDAVVALIHSAVIPRLDAGAVATAHLADRVAVVEDRNALVDLANRVNQIEAHTAVTAAALTTTPPKPASRRTKGPR